MMRGIPPWLFYTASAAIMAVSFLFFITLNTRTDPEGRKGYATLDLLRVRWLRRLLCSAFFKFRVRLFVTCIFIFIIDLPSKNYTFIT